MCLLQKYFNRRVYSSLIRRSFIEAVEATKYNLVELVEEKNKLHLASMLYKSERHLDAKYQLVDGEVRIKPSLTLTLSNNSTQIIYFDSPEEMDAFKRRVASAKDNEYIKIK